MVRVLRWHLEETILSTVLVSPLSSRGTEVNLCLLELPSIVVLRVNSSDVRTESSDSEEQIFSRLTLIIAEKLAKLGTVTVLDRLDEDVSVVEHKVVSAHTGVLSSV